MTHPASTPPVPIAIIGIGCLFPRADSVESYWANLQNGVDAITEVPPTHWRPEDYFDSDPKKPDHTYAARGGFLSPVDFPALELGISPNVLEATDTSQLLGLIAARQALDSAGYGAGKAFDRNRVSVILGVTGALELVVPLGARLGHPLWKRALAEAGVDEATAGEVVRRISESYVGWQEDSFPGLLGNVVAGRIANRLDLGGTNCVVDAACASSLSAVHLALLELAAGRSDMVITGGMDTFNSIFMYMCFSKTPALSPTGDARPFDASADGTILGEGLGCLLLKRLPDAERDRDRIYAVIRSIGTSSDGKGLAIYAPSPKGQAKALRQAYQLAGVSPRSVELLEAHGTGTRAGDAAEVTALKDVYGSAARPWCALGSVKSQIGHTKAAAGVAGLIKAVLGLHHKVLPPTIKVKQPIEQTAASGSPFYVNTEKRPWLPSQEHPRRAAVSAFGFGGSNFHCVLEEYGSKKETIDWDPDVQILAFAGQTKDELSRQMAAFPHDLSWDDFRIEAARTRRAIHEHAAQASVIYRLTIVVEKGKKDARQLIDAARALLARSSGNGSTSTPDGIYLGTKARGQVPALAMLFPGQGSQYSGMLRDLACRWPHMQQVLTDANAHFAGDRSEEPRLSDYIYPLPAFSDEQRQRNEAALRATEVAQPALGALSLGAFHVLQHFGIRPAATAGHSFGELTALGAAGWISPKSLHTLAQLRGRLMAAGSGDRGGMLAVRAPIAQIETVLGEERLDLVIANRNAPSQAVLSGSSAEIARARAAFSRRRIDCKPLPVAAAFHSPFVADARRPFADALEAISFEPTGVAVFANSTAGEYPRDPHEIRRLLAGQLAEPVRFVEQIENIHRAGIRTFVEVGPGNKLSGLIGSILEGAPHELLTLDASCGKRAGSADLARVLAQLAALGHPVQLSRWDEGQAERKTSCEKKPTLTVAICGANYVKPRNSPVESPPGNAAVKQPISPSIQRPAGGSQPPPGGLASDNGHVPAQAPPAAHDRTLALTQENLIALQKLGEQTAQLHRQFLEGQDRALQVFQTLVEQQNRLLTSSLQAGETIAMPEAPAMKVAPVPQFQPRPSEVSPPSTPDRVAQPPFVAEPAHSPERNGHAELVRASEPAAVVEPVLTSRIQTTLLDVVAAKTGYPAEMLQLDMELDTDLGIDSIKRVEIFAMMQERLPDAPAVKAEHLGTLRTLRQVVAFLGNGDAAHHAAHAGTEEMGSTRPQDGGSNGERLLRNHDAERDEYRAGSRITAAQATSVFLEVVAQKTGYPADMLDLDMELDTDLGIDSIKRVEIFALLQEKLPDAATIKAEHLGILRTLRQVVDFIASEPAALEPAAREPAALEPAAREPAAPARETRSDVPMSVPPSPVLDRQVLRCVPIDEQPPRKVAPLPAGGEVWITSEWTDLAMRLARRLDILGYRAKLVSLKDVRAMAKPVILAGMVMLALPGGVNAAFFFEALQLLQIAAAGLRSSGKSGGSVLMTVSRQGGNFGVNDLPEGADPVSGGLAGFAKTARHEWPEVHCKAVDLDPNWDDLDQAANALAEEMLLYGPAEVGLSSGGRCALELAPAPLERDARAHVPLARGDVVVVTGGARGVTAETAVALAQACAPTLVLLGRSEPPSMEPAWLATLSEEAEIKQALATRMNGQATPKDVGERYRILSANREVLRNLERIERHGAKVVYRQVDVRDAAALSAALADIRASLGPIRGLVHGAGVLADRLIVDKTLDQFRSVYDTKAASLQTMLEALAHDDLRLLALFSSSTGRFGRAGQVDYAVANEVLNKLAQREARRRPGCKVVSINWGPWDGGMVSAGLKKLFQQEGVGVIGLREGADFFVREICGPIDGSVEIVAGAPRIERNGAVNLNGKAAGPSSSFAGSVAFERELSVASMPVLRSHVIKGHPVLPAALIVEWLAHGALHANPGLAFHGFDDLKILKGVILSGEQPAALCVSTAKAVKDNGFFRVPVELSSSQTRLPHARAEIILAPKLSAAPASALELSVQPYLRDGQEIYEKLLFHGKELQGIEFVEGCSEEGIIASVACAPAPAAWIAQPLRSTWLADPLALDSAFQMMILWSFEQYGAGSLPCSAGRYRQFSRSFAADGVRVVAKVTQRSDHRALADLEFLDGAGKVLARLSDYECVIDDSLNQAFRANQSVAGGSLS